MPTGAYDGEHSVDAGKVPYYGIRNSVISKSNRVNHPWLVDSAGLKLREVIGGGHFGEIFRGYYGKDAVAIKKLSMEVDADDDTESVMSEAQLLWDLRHPRIMVFFGMCTRKTAVNTEVYLVMELCIGCLGQYLGDRKAANKERKRREREEKDGKKRALLGTSAKEPRAKQPLLKGVQGQALPEMTEKQFWQWVVEIAEGMVFVHSKGVVSGGHGVRAYQGSGESAPILCCYNAAIMLR